MISKTYEIDKRIHKSLSAEIAIEYFSIQYPWCCGDLKISSINAAFMFDKPSRLINVMTKNGI